MANGKSMLTINNSKAAKFGGAFYITHHSKMVITEFSKIVFFNNETKTGGGSIYSDLNSTITIKGDAIMTNTNNEAIQGGVIYSRRYSKVEFKSNSRAVFN